MCLLQGDRRPSTVKSYDQKWLKFESFTSEVQDDEDVSDMCALPMSSQTVVTYLGYLLNDFEYPSPAFGHLVKLVRKGFSELQDFSIFQPQQVTVFPSEHMLVIVHFGMHPDTSKLNLMLT